MHFLEFGVGYSTKFDAKKRIIKLSITVAKGNNSKVSSNLKKTKRII